jgi:hypothetical protein
VCRAAGQAESRRLDRVLVIDETKPLPRASLTDRRAQRAEDLVDAKELRSRGKVVEVDDV